MKSKSIILFALASFLSCCSGQISSALSESQNDKKDLSLIIGDTVEALPKNCWIVFQDSKNNYWFGSDGNGVYRYDGKTIIQYTSKDGLLGDRIRRIQEDHLGNILIASLEGVNKFDGKNITPIPVVESNEWRLDRNDLWFAILGKSVGGPFRYDGKVLHQLKFPKHFMEDEYFKINDKKSWSPYDPYTIYKDRKGNIWIGTAEFGLCRYDGKTISWLYEEHLTLIEGGGSFGIRSILEDKDGKFWFCNTRYRYDIQLTSTVNKDKIAIDYMREKGIQGVKSPEGRDMIYFMSSVEDNDGALWMVTYEQGVWKYDGENFIRYRVTDKGKDITLFSIYKDNIGQLWLGTHEAGAFKFNGTEFEKFEL